MSQSKKKGRAWRDTQPRWRQAAAATAAVTVAPESVAASAVAAPAAAPAAAGSSALNGILYIVLEDFGTIASPVFSPHSLGSTPHLKRLAKRAVTFQRAYCQAPLCNPSRSSLMTSRMPSATRIFSNDDASNDPVELPTLTDFLNAYASRKSSPAAAVLCAGGKIFHESCESSARGFGLVTIEPDGWAHNLSSPQHARLHEAVMSVSTVWPAVQEHPTHDQQKVLRAVAALSKLASTRRRFFLAIGLQKTHVVAPYARCSNPAWEPNRNGRGWHEGTYEVLRWRNETRESWPIAPRLSDERNPPLTTNINHDLCAALRPALVPRTFAPPPPRSPYHSPSRWVTHCEADGSL